MAQDSSYMKSSVNSFNQGESPFTSNFVKFMPKNQVLDRGRYYQQDIPQSTPLIKRHQSQNTWKAASKSPKNQQKPNTFHNTFQNRFYESIVQSISPKSNTGQCTNMNDIQNLQKQIADYSMKQISRGTELQLSKKEIKRLKQEISYMRQKCEKLQKQNQELLIYKYRAQILNRQYQNLLKQYNSLREKIKEEGDSTHMPLSLEQMARMEKSMRTPDQRCGATRDGFGLTKDAFGLSKQGFAVSRQGFGFTRQGFGHTRQGFGLTRQGRNTMQQPQKQGNRVNLKKVTGVNRQDSKRQSAPYDDLPMIQSKIDSRQLDTLMYGVSRDETKTIDLTDKSRSKLLQKKCQQMQVQISQVRKKNIDLYKRLEEYENEKLQNMQTITQLKYQRTRDKVNSKDKFQSNRKQIQRLQGEIEKYKGKMQELEGSIKELKEQLSQKNDQLSSRNDQIQQLRQQKQQIQRQLGFNRVKMNQMSSQNGSNIKKCKQLTQKHKGHEQKIRQISEQLKTLKKKYQQKQIQNKFLESELQNKRQTINQLQKQLQKQPKQRQRPQLFLKQQSNEIRTSQLIKTNQPLKANQLKFNQPQINTLITQLAHLRDQNTKTSQQNQLLRYQSERQKQQNKSLTTNYTKLTQMFEAQKKQNMKYSELRQQWRQIEHRAKRMKQIDSAVDHLWEIKEVEYDNLCSIMTQVQGIDQNS